MMTDIERMAELEKQSEKLLNDMEKAVGTPEFNKLKAKWREVMLEAINLKAGNAQT